MKDIHIVVSSRRPGERFSDFSVILPTAMGYSVEYRFSYVLTPPNESLSFGYDTGGTTNADIYRINGAFVGRWEDGGFSRAFRALQGGEISFAIREDGAADFVGGIHGDECMIAASLFADGCEIPLDSMGSYTAGAVELYEESYINRCNTPSEKIIFHKQKYSFSGGTLTLSQHIEWIGEPREIAFAFSPMLTVQRRAAEDSARVLTDTIELYAYGNDEPLGVFDTTPYGVEPSPDLPTRLGVGCAATRAIALGKSGLRAEVAIRATGGELSPADVRSRIWPRYGTSLDSKIYFNICPKEKPPRVGTVWLEEIEYKIDFEPSTEKPQANRAFGYER